MLILLTFYVSVEGYDSYTVYNEYLLLLQPVNHCLHSGRAGLCAFDHLHLQTRTVPTTAVPLQGFGFEYLKAQPLLGVSDPAPVLVGLGLLPRAGLNEGNVGNP